MTVEDYVAPTTAPRPTSRRNAALVDRLAAGEKFSILFGGQGAPWLPGLVSIFEQTGINDDPEYREKFEAILAHTRDVLTSVRDEMNRAQFVDFDPIHWAALAAAADEARDLSADGAAAADLQPTNTADDADAPEQPAVRAARLAIPDTSSAVISVPGIVFSQIVALHALEAQGFDVWDTPPVSLHGHSQGILGVAAYHARGHEGDILAIAELIGAAGRIVARRRGLVSAAGQNPMLAVSRVTRDRLDALLAQFNRTVDADAPSPVVAVQNSRTSYVVTGVPRLLASFEEFCAAVAEREEGERKAKTIGGAPLAATFEYLTSVDIGFHHPAMADAVTMVRDWAAGCGLDAELAAHLAAGVLVEPADWTESARTAVDAGARWLIDLGPDDLATRLTASAVRGRGVAVIPATTLTGARALFSPGGVPDLPTPWSAFSPTVVELPDGRAVLQTRFTQLTGRSPILLAGMTPTTVDPAIVAAAANAGHWAELAGGGQVTEPIFDGNVARLTELLDDGRSAQFNALFLDPYLWRLQLGGKRLVQKARGNGAPLDGVVITAGIPELDEATALVDELIDIGIPYVVFKPGTVDQIKQVISIAAARSEHPIIVHIEGGKAGGHHSWEDLDELLLSTYAALRAQENIVVCVGGGIGTPDIAADYLSGAWADKHGAPAMPVDGILVGTAAMAALEATTSADVKRMLVATKGSPEWIGAGLADGGMSSGRSQLGADIHEIDNAASRAGRLLDEVAGDADAVAARRAEIIAAIAGTAKPYFGDAATMTYQQWLQRYLELAVGTEEQVADARARAHTGEFADWGWLDVTHQQRFAAMLQRAEARLNPVDRGLISSDFANADATNDPYAALAVLRERYPAADSTRLHPADLPFFVQLCKTPGKPVNFVPVVDKDVRRWWRSDSLWQAHSARYSAEQVCIIPGPEAVAGIDRLDEPVGDLLGRFEATLVDRAVNAGVTPTPVASRLVGATDGPDAPAGEVALLELALAAPAMVWAGRHVISPARRLGQRADWTIAVDNGHAVATHCGTGAQLRPTGKAQVVLVVPVSGTELNLPISLPDSVFDGGAPIITGDDACQAMSGLLAIAARGGLPTVTEVDGVPTVTTSVTYSDDLAADHAAVTADGLPNDTLVTLFGAEQRPVPDVVVGLCWPAIFAVIGASTIESGEPVIEGMLDLVHLDHAISVFGAPTGGEYRVTATGSKAEPADVGLVVTVSVAVTDVAGNPVADLVERFAIRGRVGTTELTAPVIAGGARSAAATETVRKRVRAVTVAAPRTMTGFAAVSGDHNPIHVSSVAAALAGLPGPIVHGMWLSAAAQQVASASEGSGSVNRKLRGWTTRFLGMVLPGDDVEITVERVGIDRGGDLLEVTAKVGDNLVMVASAVADAPRTAFAFPGQGIHSTGMGLDQRARSKAAREAWDRADAHTRAALGFSVLAVVRDNPTELTARGITYTHPDGVLNLTQFTQAAMAALAQVQMAELREAGVLDDNPQILCGHSVGEYSALAAAAVLPPDRMLEVVFARGTAMASLVQRDTEGKSNYRMAAIRPNQCGIDDAALAGFIAEIAHTSGEFIEIVNYNLRGEQYAVAGTVAGLAALEKAIETRREAAGGKRAFLVVPGIDVPFHSTLLRAGVPSFRRTLEELLPSEFDVDALVGKYIPNLVARPFSLDRSFIEAIIDVVPSDAAAAALENYDDAIRRPRELARVLLIELLAWQFASPVRWIETQDLLLNDVSHGGLGVERFIEVGVGSAPTLAGLASKTLLIDSYQRARTVVLNVERDAAAVFATDAAADVSEDLPAADLPASDLPAAAGPVVTAATTAVATPAAAAAPSGGPRPEDLTFTAADATAAMVAIWTKIRPDQLEKTDSIESLTDGVSSRRNQLLLDLGSELNLGAIDGAAEADVTTLAGTVNTLARTYKPFGPVLTETIGTNVRKALGSSGKRPTYVSEYLSKAWELGPGWGQHVTLALATGTRDGASVRGGDFATLLPNGPVNTAADADALIDRAVLEVAAAQGVAVGKPSAGGGGGGGTVDVAALAEMTDYIAGPDGALATSARALLSKLGLAEPVPPLRDGADVDAELAALVAAELGADWAKTVAPAFDANKAVVLDDRWASAREDLLHLWEAGEEEIRDDWAALGSRLAGAGHVVAAQAQWWRARSLAKGRPVHAEAYSHIAHVAEDPTPGRWAEDVAVVTGASAGSIAAAVVGHLLGGGATVIATTSRLDEQRLEFFKKLYRENARAGARLWVVPANMCSYADVDALTEWVGSAQSESYGPVTVVHKTALQPTLLFPFAAPRVSGDMSDVGQQSELEMKILLFSVERLIVGLAGIGKDTNIAAKLHAVLPGSPNRGMFGGDGAYGEAKSALDALITRWSAESSWSERVTLVHAVIGWVRGTGLMGGNDPLVEAVEAAGVRTWSTQEMATELLAHSVPSTREKAATAPVLVDLTGGLASASLDLPALAQDAIAARTAAAAESDDDSTLIAALPAAAVSTIADPVWGAVDTSPEDMVVIVGAGEVGPYGSSRTRFEVEVNDDLSAAGVAELAWVTGMMKWENEPEPGWYDIESGELVPEADIADKYHDAVIAKCGIRAFADDGDLQNGSAPLLASVFLPEDMSFVVAHEAEARAFVDADPERTTAAPSATGEWTVTRKAGTEIRVPRRTKLLRTVGGQVPDGFDPGAWGISPEMIDSVDRLALWNLVATVDAFVSAGFDPAELMSVVHPAHVANTQGTGMGGMASMRKLFINTLIGEPNQNDILQEALPNVVAAHVVQSYIGSYGAMVHPVAACATAAVSVEEGVDKIKVGKALFAVAGGFDDLSIEGVTGFGMMQATADTDRMLAKGISPRRFSRANDRRRTGFVESQGGGTVLLARGDIAQQMGLPVLGVVAWAQSFGDGVHTSIPAPGLGALAVAAGGTKSGLARSLRQLGVRADDVAVVSKHDTSTNANDPNEAKLHEKIAESLGRSEGAPMFVVSQKSLTGHAKGGAAAFQMIGMCQMLSEGVLPPNRSLDCVDDEMAEHKHLVWLREPAHLRSTFPLKAGLITSLGFGHVSGLVAIVHRDAFLTALRGEELATYLEKARAREVNGRRAIQAAMCGQGVLYQRPPSRRLVLDESSDVSESDLEVTLLLDESMRLASDGVYR